MDTQELAKRIDAYCAEHGISEWQFGKLAVNDGKLVQRLRSGKTITIDTLRKIEGVMAAPPSAKAREIA